MVTRLLCGMPGSRDLPVSLASKKQNTGDLTEENSGEVKFFEFAVVE